MYLFFMERDNKQGTSKCQSNIGTYPLVADRVASHPYNRRSAARHCEIRPPV